MPPTPAVVPTHAPRARSRRRCRLGRTVLYALLYALLYAMPECLGEQFHASERLHGHLAAASSEVPSPAKKSEGETPDAPELSGRCLGVRPEAAALTAARVPTPTTTVASLTDAPDLLSRDPRGAVRRLLPSGGRSALISLCQWRI